MKLSGGTLTQQPYYLNSELEAENPYLPDDIIVIGYDLIGSDRVNNIAKIGPGFWNTLPTMFKGQPGGKIPLNLTSSAMSGDTVLVLNVLQSWIDQLGNNLGISQILVNKNAWPISASFTNYPVVAGTTIIITGLDSIANTHTLDLILS